MHQTGMFWSENFVEDQAAPHARSAPFEGAKGRVIQNNRQQYHDNPQNA